MCIIIVKNKNVMPPSDEIIENCFYNNPHGAGIAYCKNNSEQVIIEKGFLTYFDLLERLNVLNFNNDDLVLYHFRLGTHGLINKENTHPFPLSDKISELKKLYLETSIAIAHNGIFSNMNKSINNSDTQKFIAFILSKLSLNTNLENNAFMALLKGYCGYTSKLAFLTKNKIYLVGNFIEEKETKLLFSNDNYKINDLFIDDDPIIINESKEIKKVNVIDLNDYFRKKTCSICRKPQKVKFHKIMGDYLCKRCKKEFNRMYYSDIHDIS